MSMPLEKHIKAIEIEFKDEQGADDMFFMVNGPVWLQHIIVLRFFLLRAFFLKKTTLSAGGFQHCDWR